MSSLSVKHTSTSDLLSQPGLSLSSPLPHPLLFQPYEPTEPFSTTDLYVDGVFIDRGSYYICEKLSHGGACLLEHACGGQRTACGSQFSPSTHESLGSKVVRLGGNHFSPMSAGPQIPSLLRKILLQSIHSP